MSDIYVAKPIEVEAVQLTWANQSEVEALVRTVVPHQSDAYFVFVHNKENDSWVEQHRAFFGRLGMLIVDRLAVEKDWIIKGLDAKIHIIPEHVFEQSYFKKGEQ